MVDESAPPFLSPPHLQAIGNLTAYWAYLESTIEIAIWCFLNLKRERGALVTTHLGLVSRVSLLRELCHHKFTETPHYCEPLEELLNRVEELRIERNNIIHFLWRFDPNSNAETAEALRITARASLREVHHQRSATDINATTDQVWDFTSELQGLLEVMFPHRRLPWPRISP